MAVKDSSQGRDGAGFLKRWSERKLSQRREEEEVVAEAVPMQPATLPEPPVDDNTPAQQHDVTAEVSGEETTPIPDLQSLGEESDFSRFLKSDVAEALRRKALRKLFHLPEYNISDGLNDYDEDYTAFAPLGSLVTAEMKRAFERWQEGEGQSESVAEAAPAEAAEDPARETPPNAEFDPEEPEEHIE